MKHLLDQWSAKLKNYHLSASGMSSTCVDDVPPGGSIIGVTLFFIHLV